jgi:cytochrome b
MNAPLNALTSAGRETPPAEVQVWDPFVRVFYWSLVGLVAFAMLTGEEWTKVHIVAGYAILALIGARVLWGFVGARYARFSDFVRGPNTIRAYLSDLLRFKAPRYLGHNPLGGLMIVALLLALTATRNWAPALRPSARRKRMA